MGRHGAYKVVVQIGQLGFYAHVWLTVDAHYTWWDCGKSYLCRIVDMLHMGYVDEVLFGREVVSEMPRIVKEWVALAEAAGTPKT
jgi:hypothetical protein